MFKEYEREMKSYGIPVKEFSVQDLSDIKDIHDHGSRHSHSKEVKIRLGEVIFERIFSLSETREQENI